MDTFIVKMEIDAGVIVSIMSRLTHIIYIYIYIYILV